MAGRFESHLELFVSDGCLDTSSSFIIYWLLISWSKPQFHNSLLSLLACTGHCPPLIFSAYISFDFSDYKSNTCLLLKHLETEKKCKNKAEKFTHRQPLLLTFHTFRQSFYGAFVFTVEIRPILSNMVSSGHLWLFQVLSSYPGWWLPYGQCRIEYFHCHRKSYRTEQG